MRMTFSAPSFGRADMADSTVLYSVVFGLLLTMYVAEAGREDTVEDAVAEALEVVALVLVDEVLKTESGNPVKGTTADESIQLISPNTLAREYADEELKIWTWDNLEVALYPGPVLLASTNVTLVGEVFMTQPEG